MQWALTRTAGLLFNQISKYSQKLQSEFNQGVKDGFANSGISDLSGLSFSLDKNGKINAIGANEKDRKKSPGMALMQIPILEKICSRPSMMLILR